MRARLVFALAGALAVACAGTPEAPVVVPEAAPPGFPADYYTDALARGEPVFRIDPARSLAVIRVYRAGRLARFGHDHVVASRDVHGYVRLAGAAGEVRADLYAPLASLSVDEPGLRAEAGFDTQPSKRDIEGTRRNMLDKVLETERYPYVVLRLKPVETGAASTVVEAAVTLHGETRRFDIDVEFDQPGARALHARGRFSIKQTDFGIAPFSVLGGALRVADRLDVAFDLHAARAPVP